MPNGGHDEEEQTGAGSTKELPDRREVERTRRILGTRTETETIHRALDLVADEVALVEALRRFVVKGRGHVEDLDARR